MRRLLLLRHAKSSLAEPGAHGRSRRVPTSTISRGAAATDVAWFTHRFRGAGRLPWDGVPRRYARFRRILRRRGFVATGPTRVRVDMNAMVPAEVGASWYAQRAPEFERPRLSFDLDVDVCVIGAGLAGLT